MSGAPIYVKSVNGVEEAFLFKKLDPLGDYWLINDKRADIENFLGYLCSSTANFVDEGMEWRYWDGKAWTVDTLIKTTTTLTRERQRQQLKRTLPAPTGRLSENVLCLPEGVWVEGLGLNYDKSKWQIGTVSGFDASVASGCTYKIDLGQECADMGLRGGVRSFNLKRVQWCLLGEDVSSAEKACTSSTTVVDHLYV